MNGYGNDSYTGLILLFIGIILIVYFLRKRPPSNIFAHWHHHFDDFNISTIEFYGAIEAKLKDLELPNVFYKQVEYNEGSAFTPKRLYLHVYRYDYSFDICAAPFGKEFFISWWLRGNLGSGTSKPKPKTFYQMDTEIMFRESISKVTQEAIEDFVQAKGYRSLTPEQKQLLSVPN